MPSNFWIAEKITKGTNMTNPVPTLSCGYTPLLPHDICPCHKDLYQLLATAHTVYSQTTTNLLLSITNKRSDITVEDQEDFLTLEASYGPLCCALAKSNIPHSTVPTKEFCKLVKLSVYHAAQKLNLALLRHIQSELLTSQNTVRQSRIAEALALIEIEETDCTPKVSLLLDKNGIDSFCALNWKKLYVALMHLTIQTNEGVETMGAERASSALSYLARLVNYEPFMESFLRYDSSISGGRLMALLATVLIVKGICIANETPVEPLASAPFFSLTDQHAIVHDPDFCKRNFAATFLSH